MRSSPFREYPSVEYGYVQLPPDWKEKGGMDLRPLDVSARARMTAIAAGSKATGGRDCRCGPRIIRARIGIFPGALRRLTRIKRASVEQPVNLEDGDEVFNWPWLYAVQVGEWGLTAEGGKMLREYLLRGGFFMADDFHGTEEWEVFEKRMKHVFPDRPHGRDSQQRPDLSHRVRSGRSLPDSRRGALSRWVTRTTARWRTGCGIYDDKGRVMVAISFNSDIGDSWEWADDPRYPEKFSGLGIRIGVNYVVYAMTH